LTCNLSQFNLFEFDLGSSNTEGLILYQTLDDGEDELVVRPMVVDPGGGEPRSITLPDPISGGSFIPTESGRRVWLFVPGRQLYLIDVRQRTARELDLPEAVQSEVVPNAAQFRFSGGGERWTLIGNPMATMAYLVNLETGDAHDLTTINDEIAHIVYATFTSDEEHILINTGNLWLVPTANPSNARRLGGDEPASGGSFSSDGRLVAYVVRATTGGWVVVVERIGGSESLVVASGERFYSAEFVPGQNQLVLVEEDRVVLLSLDSGAEQELLTYAGRPQRPWFAPDGHTLLFGYESTEGATWHLADLGQGTHRPLDSLTGYHPLRNDRDHSWLIWTGSFEVGGGRQFLSLDLRSGETRQLLRVDEDTRHSRLAGFSADGQFGLLQVMPGDGDMQLWLLQLDSGESRLLAEARLVSGALSPDGRWVAVGTLERTDEESETHLALIETEGEETRSLGEGFSPVWVQP
jgi:dipeptidyl aminopeptidase/acylaminoacyl peptidase